METQGKIDYNLVEAIPEIDSLIEIVNLLPPNPVIIEVGTFLGGTTVRLAESRPDANITTVDPCNEPLNSDSNWVAPYGEYVRTYLVEKVLQGPITKSHLYNNISRFSNIKFVEGYSPECFQDWNTELDLYFEDGNHFNPVLATNLQFWSKFVKQWGYLAAHDYCDECPDVITEINKMIGNGWNKILLDRRLIVLQKVL